MSRIRFNVFLTLAALLLVSCDGLSLYLPIKRTSYVCGFFEFNQIAANGSIVNVDGKNYARIDVFIPTATMVTDVFGRRATENGTFKELCRKYNDTSYPGGKLNYGIQKGIVANACYPSVELSSVDILSEGVSVRNLAHYAGVSAYPYIKNSYSKCDYSKMELSSLFRCIMPQASAEMVWYPVDKALADIAEEDLLLPGAGHMAEPGRILNEKGEIYETPDILYYAPSVDVYADKNDWSNNLFSLFIPQEDISAGSPGYVVVVRDSNNRNLSVNVEFK